MATIRKGRRFSAADAFLHPITDRPNLTVATDATVDRVLIENGRAVGVRTRQNGRAVEYRATQEVILATGGIATPKILQLSGIGPAELLTSLGIEVVADSPDVGARMREHRVFVLQFRLAEILGYNKLLSTRRGRVLSGLRISCAARTAGSVSGSAPRAGFFKTDRPKEKKDPRERGTRCRPTSSTPLAVDVVERGADGNLSLPSGSARRGRGIRVPRWTAIGLEAGLGKSYRSCRPPLSSHAKPSVDPVQLSREHLPGRCPASAQRLPAPPRGRARCSCTWTPTRIHPAEPLRAGHERRPRPPARSRRTAAPNRAHGHPGRRIRPRHRAGTAAARR